MSNIIWIRNIVMRFMNIDPNYRVDGVVFDFVNTDLGIYIPIWLTFSVIR